MRKLSYAALLLLAVCAQAATYKWVDEQGRVQYGSNPPVGTKTEAVANLGRGSNAGAAKGVIGIHDIDALPYLSKSPVNGRQAYEKFLAATPAKLFLACSNGQYLTVVKPASSYEALYKHAQAMEGYSATLCHPYAFNDEVIWNRKK